MNVDRVEWNKSIDILVVPTDGSFATTVRNAGKNVFIRFVWSNDFYLRVSVRFLLRGLTRSGKGRHHLQMLFTLEMHKKRVKISAFDLTDQTRMFLAGGGGGGGVITITTTDVLGSSV